MKDISAWENDFWIGEKKKFHILLLAIFFKLAFFPPLLSQIACIYIVVYHHINPRLNLSCETAAAANS